MLTQLTLPTDIPWKRMGVSTDMIDPQAGDLLFPMKWRSSLAAFYYESPEVAPDYCHRKITYLKIVATITNYQIGGEDVTVLDELRKRIGQFYAWKWFESTVTDSYPCYGALLQVGVYPHPNERTPLHDFPYIAAFQPRKREMYEAVSQSGEMGSQSGSKVNVTKGTTNTDTTENYDIDLGGGGGSAVFGLASWQLGQEQKGTVQRHQTQSQNITQSDASREKRENWAHSTTINQLYTLLQGYHLGTNRALFFLQPRPHVQDMKFTFIRGLRRLEGVQEFFFVVNRPESVPGICVEIALETAHAYLQRAYAPRIIPLSDLYAPGNLQKTAGALGLSLANYGYFTRLVDTWNSHYPWVRHLTGEASKANPGYIPAEIDKRLKDGSMTQQQWSDLKQIVELLPEIGTEDVALIFEEYESDDGSFFVTGRRLCSCVTPAVHEEHDEDEETPVECEESREDHISTCDPRGSIVFERPTRGAVPTDLRNPWSIRKPAWDRYAITTNALVEGANKVLWASLGSSERAPYGARTFLDTEFVLQRAAQLLRLLKRAGAPDVRLEDAAPLQPYLRKGLGRTSNVRSLLDLGSLTTHAIARDLEVPEVEARGIRRKLLFETLAQLEPKSLEPVLARTEMEAENPIVEHLAFEFPPDRITELERSARIHVGEPTFGKSARPSARPSARRAKQSKRSPGRGG